MVYPTFAVESSKNQVLNPVLDWVLTVSQMRFRQLLRQLLKTVGFQPKIAAQRQEVALFA
jgi:hypothetical protein